jgi:hypothetical protein
MDQDNEMKTTKHVKGPYLMITPEYQTSHTKISKLGELINLFDPKVQVRQEIEGYRRYLHGVGEKAPSGYVPQFSTHKKIIGFVKEETMLNEHLNGYDRYRAAMGKYPRKWYRRKNGV